MLVDDCSCSTLLLALLYARRRLRLACLRFRAVDAIFG